MRVRAELWAVLAAVLGTGPAAAQNQFFNWDGGGTTDGWSAAANWATNVAPAQGSNVFIGFAGTTRLDPNQNIGTPFNLSFLDFLAGAGAFNLSGGSFQFEPYTAGTITPGVRQYSSSGVTIDNAIRTGTLAAVQFGGTGSGTVRVNGVISGTGGVRKEGGYTLFLGAANTFTGGVSIVDGAIRAVSDDVFSGNNVTVFNGAALELNNRDATIGTLILTSSSNPNPVVGPRVTTGTGTLTLAGDLLYVPPTSGTALTFVSGTLFVSGSRAFNIGGPVGGGTDFVTDADVFGGTITKTSAGTWLARSGRVGSNLVIAAGRVALGSAGVLGSTVTLSGDGRLDLGYDPGTGRRYFDQAVDGLNGTSADAFVDLGTDASPATLTIGTSDASSSYAGRIGGSGGLRKVGTGTLTLSGSNTYTGGTVIDGGTLAVSRINNIGSFLGGVAVRNGGTLRVTASTMTGGDTFNLTGGQIDVTAGTLTLADNTRVTGGFLRASGTGGYAVTGGSVVSGSTVLPGTRVDATGAATFRNVTSGGIVTVSGGATLAWDGGFQSSAGRLTVNGTVTTSRFESSGVITVAGGATPGRLNNAATPLVLGGGSRTFVGSVAARGGTINLGGQPLELNGGLLVNNGDFVSAGTGGVQGGTVRVNYGGLAKGTGYYEAVAVTDGGRFAPGNSIAGTTVGSLTLESGSVYEFEINRATGTAGGGGTSPPAGWDLLDLNVALDVNASAASPAVVQLVSRNGNDTAGGSLPDFDRTRAYQWLMFRVAAGGEVSGFDPAAFTFDTAAFANLTDPTGVEVFAVARAGSDVYLTFTPVPEPAAGLAVGCVVAVGVWVRRRRS